MRRYGPHLDSVTLADLLDPSEAFPVIQGVTEVSKGLDSYPN